MPDQSNGQRLWALVHRGPQASAILFPRCQKRSIRLKSKITSFFPWFFTKACLSGRWEIVPWRRSVAIKCPEGGSRCFGRLKRKHSLDYIHARLHKVCKSSRRFFYLRYNFNFSCLNYRICILGGIFFQSEKYTFFLKVWKKRKKLVDN